MTGVEINSWFLTESSPGAFLSPIELLQGNPAWIPACVPGTVAQSLQLAGLWDMDQRKDFDASDWWYSTTFDVSAEDQRPVEINFEGLATLCEIWLNGEQVYCSTNMFIPARVNIDAFIEKNNNLYLCFRSLNEALSVRKPRPAWKTRLVNQQNLRWFRTTLLGKIPGWSPPISPVGPWLPVSIKKTASINNLQVKTSLQGNNGQLEIQCQLHHAAEHKPVAVLHLGDQHTQLKLSADDDGSQIHGKLTIKDVKAWWPHTHGEPNLYPARIEITIDNETLVHTLPPIGFKTVQVQTDDGRFQLIVNEQALFCRGACWTINDIISLNGEPESLKNTLLLMQQAGANMIRIGGTMVYEQDLFYQICDELGIMVWQDFVFANMDYPIDDDFTTQVTQEISYQLTRLSQYTCLAIYCGNSEVEQQATMMGVSPEAAKNDLFYRIIPTLCKQGHPGIPYTPSTPSGDPLPFHTDNNLSHYYGIGAYQRPLNEVRKHAVKFTPETLGFANVPVTETRNKLFQGEIPVIHDPRWKQRTPRDTGTGWDFEDIRDFYLEQLYGLDPAQLRYANPERYLQLSEVTTGEVMRQVYAEWRSLNSDCGGGLIWFLKDLWPGAGWGILDSYGIPKACYFYLKRIWQPVSVVLTDESLNGIDIHVINETPAPLSCELNIQVLDKGHVTTAKVHKEITLDRHSKIQLNADKLLGHFYDLTYSYRFGPVKHNVVSASLTKEGRILSQEFFFPGGSIPEPIDKTLVKARAHQLKNNLIEVTIEVESLLYNAAIEAKGYLPDDNFFHLVPDSAKTIFMKKTDPDQSRFSCYLSALNMDEEIRVTLQTS